MRFQKGDKVQLANGTPCVIVSEYAAHDGQAYKVRWDDGKDALIAKLTAWESHNVTARENPAEYCSQCGARWASCDGHNRVTGSCGHAWMNS